MADKNNDFNCIHDQIFAARKDNCDIHIYTTKMQLINGIYDDMEMTTIIFQWQRSINFLCWVVSVRHHTCSHIQFLIVFAFDVVS